jgi:peptidoglycan hydrolase FlgJ
VSINKALYDSSVYTNLQGLESLNHEYKTNSTGVKKEVAQQFESLLVQMLLKSMRDTNKEFSSELMSSQQSDLYNDLYDKQLSLLLSKTGIGVAKSIEDFMDKSMPSEGSSTDAVIKKIPIYANEMPAMPVHNKSVQTNKGVSAVQEPDATFQSASDFVKSLWDSAKMAANIIGADPKILLAQAALETNWGKKIIPQLDGTSTNNLFNIKADSKWTKESADFNTIEEKDGVLIKEKSKFRAYNSFHDSFVDYTRFLQQNSRYSDAIKNAPDAEKFVTSLQKASYATDSLYSEKIMNIYSSKKFNQLFEQNNLI